MTVSIVQVRKPSPTQQLFLSSLVTLGTNPSVLDIFLLAEPLVSVLC